MINRIISLPQKRSFFLFGARQTGKSTLIKTRFKKNVWEINLLDSDVYLKYTKDPALFRAEALFQIQKKKKKLIFVDEIQRIPILLNEVQTLIQSTNCQFILTGSSVRKLKRGGANLLAGRAAQRFLFPLTAKELADDFDLNKSLLYGNLPSLTDLSPIEKRDVLSAYVHTYLKEEIQAEGIVRQLSGFSRFLDVAAAQTGDLVNFSSIGQECFISTKTVQSYYEILEDTLIGFRLNPWRSSHRKRLSAQPKYYLADNGITNAIMKRLTSHLDPLIKGKLFEQWIIHETNSAVHYNQSEANLFFWRTNHGAEVDLIIEKHGKIRAAFEIKINSRIFPTHLSGLRAFRQDHPKVPCFIICQASNPVRLHNITILPWKSYLDQLSDFI